MQKRVERSIDRRKENKLRWGREKEKKREGSRMDAPAILELEESSQILPKPPGSEGSESQATC